MKRHLYKYFVQFFNKIVDTNKASDLKQPPAKISVFLVEHSIPPPPSLYVNKKEDFFLVFDAYLRLDLPRVVKKGVKIKPLRVRIPTGPRNSRERKNTQPPTVGNVKHHLMNFFTKVK